MCVCYIPCVLYCCFWDQSAASGPRTGGRPGPRPVGPQRGPPPSAYINTSSYILLKKQGFIQTILLCFTLPRTASCLLSPHFFMVLYSFTCMHFPFLFFYLKNKQKQQKNIRGKKEVRGRKRQQTKEGKKWRKREIMYKTSHSVYYLLYIFIYILLLNKKTKKKKQQKI